MTEFKLFGVQHIISLLVTFGLALLNLKIIYLTYSKQKQLAIILGFFLLSFYPIYQIYYIFFLKTWEIQTHLQLHLSNFIILFLALSLLFKNRVFFVIAFFWALAGGFSSVLFPDLKDGFPSINFLFFWASHSILLFLVFFLKNYRKEFMVKYQDIWVAFLAILTYVLIMLPVNQLLGSNYGYLRQKPPALNFLDKFGFANSPNYLLPLIFLILLLFHIVYLIIIILPKNLNLFRSRREKTIK
jgi:hypothetical integral membrane protein (TIGR02206 family)